MRYVLRFLTFLICTFILPGLYFSRITASVGQAIRKLDFWVINKTIQREMD